VAGFDRTWQDIFDERNILKNWPLHTDMVRMARELNFSAKQVVNLPNPFYGELDDFIEAYKWISEMHRKRFKRMKAT